jgi:hypothetical protein
VTIELLRHIGCDSDLLYEQVPRRLVDHDLDVVQLGRAKAAPAP